MRVPHVPPLGHGKGRTRSPPPLLNRFGVPHSSPPLASVGVSPYSLVLPSLFLVPLPPVPALYSCQPPLNLNPITEKEK